jgi:hypothetical protein
MITLNYIIRQLLDPNNPFLMCDPGQEAKYNARLAGSLFNQDNKQVFQILKDLTLGIPSMGIHQTPRQCPRWASLLGHIEVALQRTCAP